MLLTLCKTQFSHSKVFIAWIPMFGQNKNCHKSNNERCGIDAFLIFSWQDYLISASSDSSQTLNKEPATNSERGHSPTFHPQQDQNSREMAVKQDILHQQCSYLQFLDTISAWFDLAHIQKGFYGQLSSPLILKTSEVQITKRLSEIQRLHTNYNCTEIILFMLLCRK